MTTINKRFGKLNQDGTIDYARVPLRITRHFREERDEEVFDEETGEPTGETVKRTYDYDTHEMKLRPTVQDYLDMGYLPVVDVVPDAAEGYHNIRTGKWTDVGGELCPAYETVQDAPQPMFLSKSKIETAIDSMGKTAEFIQWLNSKASYIGGWMRGGDAMQYDPEEHGTDLESLIAALEIPQEDVPSLIEQVKA